MTARTLDEFVKSQPVKAERIDQRHLRALQQAEVSAENLTGDPDWDAFLSNIQAAINQTAEQMAALQRKLMDPMLVDHGDMLTIKATIAECRGRIQAWTAAINLPKEIKEKGERARAAMDVLRDDG